MICKCECDKTVSGLSAEISKLATSDDPDGDRAYRREITERYLDDLLRAGIRGPDGRVTSLPVVKDASSEFERHSIRFSELISLRFAGPCEADEIVSLMTINASEFLTTLQPETASDCVVMLAIALDGLESSMETERLTEQREHKLRWALSSVLRFLATKEHTVLHGRFAPLDALMSDGAPSATACAQKQAARIEPNFQA